MSSAAVAERRRGDSTFARVAAAIWALMTLGVLAVGALGSEGTRAAVLDDGPGCFFKAATGIDCVFCGMTHATVALGAGDWSASHAAHPLALVVVLGALTMFALVTVGRADLLLRGRIPAIIFSTIAVVWAVKLIA